MTTPISNAFKAFVEDGEVVLQVGQRRARDPLRGRVEVELTDQIALPPDAARRLAQEIRRALDGAPEPRPLQEDARQVPLGHVTPHHEALPSSVAHAREVEAVVSGLAATHTRERSLRLRPGEIRANRFLLSLDRDAIPGPVAPRVLQGLSRLRFPEASAPKVQQRVEDAACLHFGFEESAEGVRLKFYVECALVERATQPGPVLLHEAWKWDPAGASPLAETRYWWPGSLDEAGLRALASRGVREQASLSALVGTLLDRALTRAPAADVQLLEVEEGEGPRRSVDLNLYDAGLRVGDAAEALRGAGAELGVPGAALEAVLGQIEGRALGHVAIGSDRDGAPFVTVYYGAEGRRG